MLACLRAPLLALLVAAPAILVLNPSPAAAQPGPTSAERQEVARTKAEQGLKLFGADRWQEAYEWFREADVLYHAPTISLYMGRCLRKMGRLLDARAQYEKLVAEPIPRDAPAAFIEAQDAAKTELEAVRKLTPTIELAASDAPAGAVTWTLDGKPTSADKRDLDPGNHTVEATVNGVKAVKAFTLAEGAHQRIDVSFAPVAGPSKPPPPEAPRDAAPVRGSIVPGAVLLGVGAAGLGVGAITGALSLGKVSDVKSRCKAGVCLASDQAEADSARTLGHLSTATFILGGVAAAAGVVLIIVRPGGKAPAKTASGLDLRAGLGFGTFDLKGSF